MLVELGTMVVEKTGRMNVAGDSIRTGATSLELTASLIEDAHIVQDGTIASTIVEREIRDSKGKEKVVRVVKQLMSVQNKKSNKLYTFYMLLYA